MCQCTPELKTPWCGKPGCESPARGGEVGSMTLCPECSCTGAHTTACSRNPYRKRVVWENFATGASGDLEAERAFLRSFGAAYDLFCERHRDYGRGNIAKIAERGVASRLDDKLERLKTLIEGARDPAHETRGATWLDVANYGLIGYMVYEGRWPSP